MGLHMSYYLQGAVGDLSSSQILTAVNLLRHVYGGRCSASPYHSISPTVFPAGTYFSTQHVPSEPCGRDWLVTHQVISFFLKGTQLVPFQSPFGWVLANGEQVDVSLPSVKPPVSPPSTFALLSCLLARGRGSGGGRRSHKMGASLRDRREPSEPFFPSPDEIVYTDCIPGDSCIFILFTW